MTVLDTYALIAFLRAEVAASRVAELLGGDCAVSAVTVAETIDVLVRRSGVDAADLETDIATLVEAGLQVLDVTAPLAFAAGGLRARYYDRLKCPVSLADCLIAATAIAAGAELATADVALASMATAAGGLVIELPPSDAG